LGKPDVSLEEAQKIAEIVGLTDFIESQEEGYNSNLISEGKNLAKSIRLKIMLARCLVGNPKLILLENNFNQLNEEDKKRFLDYVLERKSTVVAISNDPNVAGQFDRVAILQEGRVISINKLEELKKEDWYSNLYQNS
jgi:ABC-type bacteriocin/lantibiotic exporter with double-glycine peptidase domain